MWKGHRVKTTMLGASILTLAGLLAAGTSAVALEVSADAWSGPAFPDGAPATTTITVSYDCGTLLPAPLGEDITLTHEAAAGIVMLSADSFAVRSLPDCTPGETVEEEATLSYSATRTMLAGSTVSITLSATGPAIPEDETAEETITATVGPYVQVEYEAVNTTMEAAPGETAEFQIIVRSDSNTETTTTAAAQAPDGWEAPSIPNAQVPSRLLEGETGEGSLRFTVSVPADAEEGDQTITVRLSSHSSDMPQVETAEVAMPFVVRVTAPLEDPDANDGPAPAAIAVLLVIAALVASRRRRTA